ncbi:ABC transporter ATP-binding protein [Actinoallomurus sp. CA-142502]|uniref:ABC transporter ATP-binding protein n=1 Tax=Actinoallomurus sp. CA-142502 TaxID=3239885 RepID=UPI003D9107EB
MRWGLDGVTVRFGSRVALADVTVPAEPSAVTVVVGGDGAGKSTCLRSLVGLVRPDEGRVSRPPKTRIGYVPATGGLYPDLTVAENLAFAVSSYGVPGADVGAMLDRIGLAGARDRLGGRLSGGMQRKLSVGLALIHGPDLLVLDEPTTGVDPVSRMELWRLVSGAAAGGTAVVVATTYVNEAERGTRAVLLDDGRVLADGSAADIAAGVPGAVGRRRARDGVSPGGEWWRRGAGWRVWSPSGDLPEGTEAVRPDLHDAAIVAALAAERGTGGRSAGAKEE